METEEIGRTCKHCLELANTTAIYPSSKDELIEVWMCDKCVEDILRRK